MTSPHTRKVMRANKSRDTGPELTLRRLLHKSGLRYRVNHRVDVDGFRCRPDVVFPKRRVAVFADGCFWHACPDHYVAPGTNVDYWTEKVQRNLERDRRTDYALEEAGWAVVRVWEHDLRQDAEQAARRVAEVVRWEPGAGVPAAWSSAGWPDDDTTDWGDWGNRRWCCTMHPDSDHQFDVTEGSPTHARHIIDLIDDESRNGALQWLASQVEISRRGHASAVAAAVCEPCGVAWNHRHAGRECWVCGQVPAHLRGPETARAARAAPLRFGLEGWSEVGWVELDEVTEFRAGGGRVHVAPPRSHHFHVRADGSIVAGARVDASTSPVDVPPPARNR